jgi:type I restriction enzyme S subunit
LERQHRIVGKSKSSLYPYYGANGQVGWIDGYIFDEPLILLAEDGGFFGSSERPIAYKITGKSWVNNHAHVLRPREGIDIDYCLHAITIRPDIGKMVTGNTRLKLNQEIASQILVPLPPTLAEQKYISQILSEQMATVEKARAAARARVEAAKGLPAAYLKEVFESKEALYWPLIRLRDACDQIDYGYTASSDRNIKEPRFLRITDIQNGLVDWDSVPGCKISETEEKMNLLLHGDIVFARTGGTVGKSYLITNPPRAVFASYLIRLRPKKTIVYPEYLYSFFQSDNYWKQLRKSSRGGAQPNVNATLLGNLELPVPSIPQQEALLLMLREKMTCATKIVTIAEAEMETINTLPGALLRQAFSGGL